MTPRPGSSRSPGRPGQCRASPATVGRLGPSGLHRTARAEPAARVILPRRGGAGEAEDGVGDALRRCLRAHHTAVGYD